MIGSSCRRAPVGLALLALACAGPDAVDREGPLLDEPVLELATLDLPVPVESAADVPGEVPDPGHRFRHLGEAPRAVNLPGSPVPLGFDDLLAPDWRPPRAIELEPRPAIAEVLPAVALEADGWLAVMEGFPLPADGRGARSRRWLLTPAPNGCCTTGPAPFDQLVLVDLASDPGWDGDPYRPVRVVGRFRAEERRDDFGFLECLYRMDEAHRIEPPRRSDR